MGQKLTKSSFDPEVLIASGYVDNTGNAVLGDFYRNPTGTVDANIDPSGTFAIQVLSGSGAVLSKISFTPNFTITDLPTVSRYCPFVLKLAYPSNAASIRIVNGSSVLASENIAYGLLLRAVQNLQDSAFVANPTQHRIALLNMINAFNLDLASSGNKIGAYTQLTQAIQPSVSAWLSSSYVAPNPLFYTRATLLSLINELAQRLNTQ